MQKIIDFILYYTRYFYLLILNGFKVKTALFYPRKPSHKAVASKIIRNLNYNISTNPNSKFQLAINWVDATFREKDDILQTLTSAQKVLNSECLDISKNYIGKIFQEVFGYPLLLDPFTHTGKCVKKNNLNASKVDTEIVQCPVEKTEDGYVYLKLINAQLNDDIVIDYRISVIGNSIPILYLKKKPLKHRFLNDAVEITMHSPDEFLSKEELDKTLQLCNKIGLDYGELDILRDNDDGKIYIIDANNTPWGPPADLTKQDNKKALEILTAAFEKEYLSN